MTRKEKAVKAREAIAYLKLILKPGHTLYTTVTKVSRSGMYRRMLVLDARVTSNSNGKPFIENITQEVAHAIGAKYHDDHTLGIGGTGMDMCFHVVYSLGTVLFGRGAECAALGYVTGRNGDTAPDTDGGYLLKKQSI